VLARYAVGMLRLAVVFPLAVALTATAANDPYASLTPDEATQVKPVVQRWILDQVKHNWADMWKIQDQTPELKNELLLGRKNARWI